MSDVVLVQVVYSLEHLLNYRRGILLFKPRLFLFHYLILQVSALTELGDHVYPIRVFIVVDNFYNRGMIQSAKQLDFVENPFDVFFLAESF